MTDDDLDAAPPMKRVQSYLATPYRPADASDLLQPIAPVSPVRPPRSPVSDADLTADVQAGLDQDGRLSRRTMTVAVQAGIVTVEGDVGSEYQRSLVTATINSIPGVLNVRNLLQVR